METYVLLQLFVQQKDYYISSVSFLEI